MTVRALTGATALAAAMVLGGCWGGGGASTLTGVSGGSGGGGLGGGAAQTLVGTWQRTVQVTAGADIQSAQTTWQFRSDGFAFHDVVVTDFTTGTTQSASTAATWSVNGSTVTLVYQLPDSGVQSFSFQVNGDTMVMDGLLYLRTG